MNLPKDSLLNHWTASLSITEIPKSYQILSGISLIGGLLRRNVHFDQEKFKIYPNISVLFVGPSGIGKDVVINQITGVVRSIYGMETDRIVTGKTIEKVFSQLSSPAYGDCAAVWLTAPELTAFLGGKDYQKSMVQDLTDLLSSNPILDVSIKSERRVIHQPTVCMLAGSTAEWLQRSMPEGSMEGGFIPRFVVVYEEYPSKHVALIKHGLTKQERQQAIRNKEQFVHGAGAIIRRFDHEEEFIMTAAATDLYTSWYHNRFERYPPTIREYANRARDQILRLALVCAVSRMKNYISSVDVNFAIETMDYIAGRIELAIRPASMGERIGGAVLAVLPITTKSLIRRLGKSFVEKDILTTLSSLQKQGKISKDGDLWRKIDG